MGLVTHGLGAAVTTYKLSPGRTRRGLRQEMNLIGEELIGEAKRNITGSRASNPPHVLGVRSGRLRQSLGKRLRSEGSNLVLRVGPQRVVYGAIHELGGLAGRGGTVRIPARPYLKPALAKKREGIAERIGDRFIDEIGRG